MPRTMRGRTPDLDRNRVGMKARSPLPHHGDRGFTFVEVVLVVVVLGVLAGIAIPAYVSMTKQAESASVEHLAGTLSSALNIYSAKMAATGQPPTSANPFDNLAGRPDNYVGVFADVNLSNCQPGQWAFQAGDVSNGNWPVVVYRPKATLATAFVWSGVQWIIYEVKPVTNELGSTVGLALVEYPPLHKW